MCIFMLQLLLAARGGALEKYGFADVRERDSERERERTEERVSWMWFETQMKRQNKSTV